MTGFYYTYCYKVTPKNDKMSAEISPSRASSIDVFQVYASSRIHARNIALISLSKVSFTPTSEFGYVS
jgi:hypothetical protein